MDCHQQSGMLRIIPQFVALCQMFDKMLMRRVNQKKDKKEKEKRMICLLKNSYFFFFVVDI